MIDFLTRGGKMGSLVRSFPWAATKLGSVDQWPQNLRSAVRVCLESRQPAVILWGIDLLSIYNDSFIPMLGDEHLMLLGNSANLFPELWRTVGEIVASVFETGKPEWHDDLTFILERNRHQEECHMQASFSPITGDSGEIGGVCCLYTETTPRVISERQLQIQVQLATRLADTTSPIEVCRAAADSLRADYHDVTFACFYLFDEQEKKWRLCSSAGIEAGTEASPYMMPTEGAGLSPIAKAVRTGRNQIVDAEEMAGCFPTGPWRISPRSIAVLPLNAGLSPQRGVMIAGLNPYRKIDEAYNAFLEQFASAVARSIAEQTIVLSSESGLAFCRLSIAPKRISLRRSATNFARR